MTSEWDRAPGRLLEFTTVLAAVWQVYGTVMVRGGFDFHALLMGLPIAVLLAIGLWGALGDVLAEDEGVDEPVQPVRISLWWSAVSGTFTLVALYGWYSAQWSWYLAWSGFVAHLLILGQGLPTGRLHGIRATPIIAIAVVALCLFGSYMSLNILLPEGDDAYYLNQVVATLENPSLPLLSFDGMHGDLNAPIQQVGHRAQLFETLASVVAWISGHPGGDAYYIYLPAFFGALAVLVNWGLAVTLCGRRAGTLAMLAFLPIALLWGGHYYTYGNYTFNRIFQGKAVAFLVGLPLCTLFGLRFGLKPTLRTAAYVAMAQLTAASHTSSALIIAPVAAALGALIGLTPDRRGVKVALLGGLSTVPTIWMLFLVKFEMDALPKMPFSGEKLDLTVLMGGEENIRIFLGPALLVGVITAARWHAGPASGLLMRFLLVLVVFLFNDTTTRFLGDHAGAHISWRGYWAAPYITLLAIGFGMALDRALFQRRHWRDLSVGFAAVALLVGFVRAGPPTYFHTSFARWKVPALDLDLSNALVGLTTPDSVALLAPRVSGRVTGFTGRPKLLNARRIYARNLARYWGHQEARHRQYLLRFVDTGEEVDYLWALQQLEDRCVDLFVATPTAHRRHRSLRRDLLTLNFRRERFGRYTLFYRNPNDCRPGVAWDLPREPSPISESLEDD